MQWRFWRRGDYSRASLMDQSPPHHRQGHHQGPPHQDPLLLGLIQTKNQCPIWIYCFKLAVPCTCFDHQELTATTQRAPGINGNHLGSTESTSFYQFLPAFIQKAPRINSNHPEATRNQQQPSTAHQQSRPKKIPLPKPFKEQLSRRRVKPPPPPQTPPPSPPVQCVSEPEAGPLANP